MGRLWNNKVIIANQSILKCRGGALSFISTGALWLFVFMATGCSQTPRATIDLEQIVAGDGESFGVTPKIPSPEQLFRINNTQRNEILSFLNSSTLEGLPVDRKIFTYLTQDTYNFNFRAQTYTVEEAIAHREGNCLTLAMVTTAIASLIGAEVEYQLVDSPPVFGRDKDVVSRGVHVRSHIVRPKSERSRSQNITMGTIIDYFPSRDANFVPNITEPEIISSYYNNIAVGLLGDNQLELAYWYTREALKHAPNYAANIITLAVIYRRHGNWQKAEAIYQWALENANEKLIVLKNYRALLMYQGRNQEADQLTQQLARLNDPSPYPWLDLADEAFDRGNYKEARSFYKKSIRLGRHLKGGYLGLAKTWCRLGEFKKARRVAKNARKQVLDIESQLQNEVSCLRIKN